MSQDRTNRLWISNNFLATDLRGLSRITFSEFLFRNP